MVNKQSYRKVSARLRFCGVLILASKSAAIAAKSSFIGPRLFVSGGSSVFSPSTITSSSSDLLLNKNVFPLWQRRGCKKGAPNCLSMVRTRGLEIREEGATPTAGGMTLFIKAGPDGKSVGDCPFAHFVRMVLHEKGLEYELKPSVQETKPQWLIDHYGGKMPALQHRKECYVESDVIAQYLDFFFPEPSMLDKKKFMAEAEDAIDGFFPSVAKYLKHTPDGNDDDLALKGGLEASLQKLEAYLAEGGSREGPFLVGNGTTFTLLDCSLAPKLYHMTIGVKEFKSQSIDFSRDYPAVAKYMDAVFERDCFQQSKYPEETVLWGWGNARKK